MGPIMRTAASGLYAQATKLEVLANNLANVQTTGFKSRRVGLADLTYQELTRSGWPAYGGRVGTGTAVAEIGPDFAGGALLETGRPFDVAVLGSGFLAVQLPDGSPAYTRDGHLVLTPGGRLVHAGTGYPLLPEIAVPEEAQQVSITPDGRVWARTAEGEPEEVGQIWLYRFVNPQGLVARGENLWLAGELSGEPEVAAPGTPGWGSLGIGQLEASNVDVAEQMVEMLLAQRAYQLNARMITTADEMWSLANDLRR
ncbi:MAG: flagellar hook-basal body protein [Clostridia bacterium]|nr:flagellar hook-basal body protein [Clostridia bacterium]MDH7573478.1 flagellar hook-basal body protein [Clostridia bacterium]